MKIINSSLVLFSLVSMGAVVGCTHNNSPASPNLNPHLNESAVGVFSPTDSDRANVPSRFTRGCTTAGSSNGITVLDPRLQIGQETKVAWFIEGRASTPLAFTVDAKLATLTNHQAVYNSTVEESSSVSFAPGTKYNESCTLDVDANTEKFECSTDPALSPLFGVRDACYLEGQITVIKHVETPGQFKMASGQIISAYQIEDTTTATVKCDSDHGVVELGQGEDVVTKIVSNDLVSQSGTACGGSEVLRSDIVEIGPAIVTRRRSEVLSAPYLP